MAELEPSDLLKRLAETDEYRLHCEMEVFIMARVRQQLPDATVFGKVDYQDFLRTGKRFLPPYIRCELRELLNITT